MLEGSPLGSRRARAITLAWSAPANLEAGADTEERSSLATAVRGPKPHVEEHLDAGSDAEREGEDARVHQVDGDGSDQADAEQLEGIVLGHPVDGEVADPRVEAEPHPVEGELELTSGGELPDAETEGGL